MDIGDIIRIITEVDAYTTSIGSSVIQQNSAMQETSENVAQASTDAEVVANNIKNITNVIQITNDSAEKVAAVSESLNERVIHLNNSVDNFLKNVANALFIVIIT